jgi:hypothetical protein
VKSYVDVTAASRAGATRARQSDAATHRQLPRWLQSPFVWLFLVLTIAYAYTPPRWQDWNQNSRFDLTRAIVDDGTVQIDRYAANTGDYATIDGHIYSDKAPGLSLAAVPVYAATRVIRPFGFGYVTHHLGANGGFVDTLNAAGAGTTNERIDAAVALYLATLLCVGLPAAVMAVLLARMVEHCSGCRTAGILAALIIGLATPVFTYAQAFYGHVLAAALLIGAMALLVLRPGSAIGRWRLLALGGLLGAAVIVEYPAAIVGLGIAAWALWLARSRAVVFGVLGALPSLLVLAIYDQLAFGTLKPIGYEHSTLWQDKHATGFMSLTHPTWHALWGLTGSPFRGLFFFAPVLLVALVGALMGLRNLRERTPVFVACVAWLGMLLFASSSVMWWGGFSVGPRYILPAVPFLALPLGVVLARINRAHDQRLRLLGLAGIGALSAVSTVLVWAASLARQNYPPDTISRPLTAYAWPALRDGDVARNLGMALQLAGVESLIPLLLLLALGMVALGANLARAQAPAR